MAKKKKVKDYHIYELEGRSVRVKFHDGREMEGMHTIHSFSREPCVRNKHGVAIAYKELLEVLD